MPDTQTDVCWTVITGDGKYAYITNFGSGTLSSYRIASNDAITLLQTIAGRTAQAQGPRDQDFSRDGKYLYVIDVGFANPATRAVNAFQGEERRDPDQGGGGFAARLPGRRRSRGILTTLAPDFVAN